ncbi:MAG: dihydroorotase [Saprospiraceae bacterium]|nr:dihydroorotase [Saprospiraceae bacterium]
MLLLRNIYIIAPSQPDLDGQSRDIFINGEGKIQNIATANSLIADTKTRVFDTPNAHVSIGWFDVGAITGDPGFEHRETLETVSQAAMSGGYTTLAPFPNTAPVVHSKSEILYIRNKTQSFLVDFKPIGALSVNTDGKDLAEMLDMREAGAIAFSDGRRTIQDAGLMLRGLQYAKIFDGLVFNRPNDKTTSPHGQMHEGVMSTSLGLPAIPSMAEEMMVQRDLHLVRYADSRLHFHNLSAARSVALVRQAKEQGLHVTASVAALNLCFSDDILRGFDTHFKVMPPLREAADRDALVEGLKDGTIDFITSNHTPIDEEGKNLEFAYADFGAIGLETTFGLVNKYLHDEFTAHDWVCFLAENARRVLQLPLPKIAEGELANLTIFDPSKEWTFTVKDIRSKSKNSPVIGDILRGGVLGVVNRGQYKIGH